MPHRASGKRRPNKKSISCANTLFPSQLNSLMAPGSIGRAKRVIVEEVRTLALHDPMACLAAYPFPFPCCSKASKSSPGSFRISSTMVSYVSSVNIPSTNTILRPKNHGAPLSASIQTIHTKIPVKTRYKYDDPPALGCSSGSIQSPSPQKPYSI